MPGIFKKRVTYQNKGFGGQWGWCIIIAIRLKYNKIDVASALNKPTFTKCKIAFPFHSLASDQVCTKLSETPCALYSSG